MMRYIFSDAVTARQSEEYLTYSGPCILCGKTQSVTLSAATARDLHDDRLFIQNVMEEYTPDEREFVMTGLCPACFNCAAGGVE
jgi:hypothetical protein